MNPHVLNELGAHLRWLTFPENAKEAITRIDSLYYSFKHSNLQWNPEAVVPIVDQFVFNMMESKELGVTKSRLISMEKLHLAEIILTYLSARGEERDRRMLFNTLFSRSYYKGESQLLVLSLVTSLAVATIELHRDILECIGLWMMQMGIESQATLYIANDITKDLSTDEFVDKYQDLPQEAFNFTAVLLIAIGKNFSKSIPPKRLVPQIIGWIENCPSICFLPPHSAIFELFRWCMHGIEEQSRLHLAILNSVEKGGMNKPLQVIPHLMTLIQEIRRKAEYDASNAPNGYGEAALEKNTERLFQLIQILIGARCLDPHELHPIFEASEEVQLPRIHLYNIMKLRYLK